MSEPPHEINSCGLAARRDRDRRHGGPCVYADQRLVLFPIVKAAVQCLALPGPGRVFRGIRRRGQHGRGRHRQQSVLATRRRCNRELSWQRKSIRRQAVQWLVEDGKPQAAILRIWRTETTKEGVENEVQELIVFKVQSASACQYAVVKASQPSANELAVARALEASSATCPEK